MDDIFTLCCGGLVILATGLIVAGLLEGTTDKYCHIERELFGKYRVPMNKERAETIEQALTKRGFTPSTEAKNEADES